MRVCKHGCDALDLSIFLEFFNRSNRALFPCLQSLSKHLGWGEGVLGKFLIVMQIQEVDKALYNCLKFSKPSSCLDEAV